MMKEALDYKYLPGKWEALYIRDPRKWSQSNYLMWLNVATDCQLGCRYCHEHNFAKIEWLDVNSLDDVINAIDGNSTFHISPSLGDILLSPYKYQLLDYIALNNHKINLFSFFPRNIDLREVEYICHRYEKSICICWSLHGYDNESRQGLFRNPHKIEDILPIINKERCNLNRVYVFSNLVNNKTRDKYIALLNRFNPLAVEIAFNSFIDYTKDEILLCDVGVPIKYKVVTAKREVLKLLYNRDFQYVRG